MATPSANDPSGYDPNVLPSKEIIYCSNTIATDFAGWPTKADLKKGDLYFYDNAYVKVYHESVLTVSTPLVVCHVIAQDLFAVWRFECDIPGRENEETSKTGVKLEFATKNTFYEVIVTKRIWEQVFSAIRQVLGRFALATGGYSSTTILGKSEGLPYSMFLTIRSDSVAGVKETACIGNIRRFTVSILLNSTAKKEIIYTEDTGDECYRPSEIIGRVLVERNARRIDRMPMLTKETWLSDPFSDPQLQSLSDRIKLEGSTISQPSVVTNPSGNTNNSEPPVKNEPATKRSRRV
jgi:hypothetical protein